MANWLNDAGHGGSDPGAGYNGRRESDDVLRLSLRVGEILKSNGENVDYTRTTDATLSLSQRSAKDLAGNYDYFISFHRNAIAPEKAKGVETHVYLRGGKAEQLATRVNNAIVGLGFVNRGVKVSNFHVLRETKSEAILIECGFIDHSTDNALFDSKFEEIAQAIAKACLEQVGKTPSVTPPSTTPSGELYRVRKTWTDAASQIGAYANLDNAKALCDKNPGYSVFNSKGEKVYPFTKSKIDVIYKAYANGVWYPEVKNLSDYAGVYGQSIQAVMARLSSGSVEYRVAPIGGNYYPWVRDHSDYAGVYGKNIDKLQMRLVGLSGYKIKYRVHLLGGSWLPWVEGTTDYAGIPGSRIDAFQVEII